MMRVTIRRTAAIAASLVFTGILAACNGGGDATETPSDGAPGGSPTGSATAATGVVIEAANAGRLELVDSFPADGAVQLSWGTDNALLVVRSDGVDRYGATEAAGVGFSSERVLAAGGDLVATADDAGVSLHSIARGERVATLDVDGAVSAAQFIGGDRRLLVVSADRIEATIWDIETGNRATTLSGFETAAPVYNAIVSADGLRAAWVARGTLQFTSTLTGTPGERIQFEDFIAASAFAADGNAFVTAVGTSEGGAAALIQSWNPNTGAQRWRVEQSDPVRSLAISHRSGLVAAAASGVRLYAAPNGAHVGTIEADRAGGIVTLASFSPDGQTLATVSEDGMARLWRVTP